MFKFKYANKEEFEKAVPEGARAMYKEVDGEYVLAVDGVKSQADIDALKKALDSERDAHKETRKALSEIEELKKLLGQKSGTGDPNPGDDGKGGKDSSDPNVLALKKELEQQKKALEDLQKEREALAAEKKKHTILENLRKVANGKVRQEAMSDLELHASMFNITDDGKVVTSDGTDLNTWFADTLKSKPHWLPKNTSSGASGGTKTAAGVNGGLDEKKAKFKEMYAKKELTPQERVDLMKLGSEIKQLENSAEAGTV